MSNPEAAGPSASDGNHHQKLGQFFATAICGNDILSSALYVSGVAIIFTGIWAPVVLLFICLVLFLYKSVYTEVVEALPLNGGAYNCLLNGTSKTFAATAGTMTILSYMATAVLSGVVGVQYLTRIINVPVIPATIALLGLLAILVISGIKDSAKVAFGIFAVHVVALTAFVLVGGFFALHHGTGQLVDNLHHTGSIIASRNGIITTLALGFSASLLGVSGFESSANFVEEQRKGVFRKTLRNMLIGVTIFNPLIALVVLNSMSIHAAGAADNFLLAEAARVVGGKWFADFISLDAFVVLWGAVLTSFVGVSGLMHRMAGDACLPPFIAKENKRGSYPYIILIFFALCSSVLLITHGQLLSLAGVYTIAFLGVMSSFALGNLILKLNRSDLKRTYRAPVLFAIFAFMATAGGIVGNIELDPRNFTYFLIYFIPAFIIVLGVIYADVLLATLLRLTRSIPFINRYLERSFNDLIQGRFVVLVHNTHRLAKILNYIYRNETGRKVTLVVCRDTDKEHAGVFKEIKDALPFIKKAGMYPHLDVELVYKDKPFTPEMIDEVSEEFKVRKNRMLIGSIHGHHPFNYDELGGVRIIF